MKKLVIILSAMSLTGCFYQSVDQYDLHRAIKHCGSLEQISQIRSHAVVVVHVDCTDKAGKTL